MSAENQDPVRAQLDAAASALAGERMRRVALARELRVLEDMLADARSAALEGEQAARAARFLTVAEAEARLAAEAWGAELAQQLSNIHASRAYRCAHALGALARRARGRVRRSA